MDEKNMSLLDKISSMVGSAYLSDLSATDRREQIVKVIETLPAGDYPLWQWQEAVSYILREDTSFADSDKARDYLLSK